MSLTLSKFVEHAIDLFLEYRDIHGYNETEAKQRTVIESSGSDCGYELKDTMVKETEEDKGLNPTKSDLARALMQLCTELTTCGGICVPGGTTNEQLFDRYVHQAIDGKGNNYGPGFELYDLAESIAALTIAKNKSYGDSFNKSGKVLEILYPAGVKPEQYTDMLCVVRIIDKLFRIASEYKEAFGESPYVDIVGYSLKGAERDELKNRSALKGLSNAG